MTVEEVAPSGPATQILQPGDKIVKVSFSNVMHECILRYTVIHEFFVVKKILFCAKQQKIFTRKLLLYTVNIWCAFDMNENIVTQENF